jgi:alpha-L-fucosidase
MRRSHGHGKLQAVINAKAFLPERAPLGDGGGYGTRASRRYRTASLADRYLHRRMALQPPALREQRIQERSLGDPPLCDIVSKNGNLLLSVPVRSDGTIDEKETAIVEGIASGWGASPKRSTARGPGRWRAKGPTQVAAGAFNESKTKAFTAADIRFTTKGGALYAITLGKPETESLTIASVKAAQRVEVVGSPAR